MYEDPKSKISQLEKVLDAREDLVSKKIKRHELHDHENKVNQAWDDSEFGDSVVGLEVNSPQNFTGGSLASLASENEKRGMSVSIKILLGSIIFFIIALAVVAFEFLGGGNIVSGDNIEISVRAPVSIAGGELLPFEIEIKNNNNVKLLGADLGITFPIGARQVNDTSVSAKRVQEYLGDIPSGGSVKKNLDVVLFGSENETKEINIALEYKVPGSNSLFNKNKQVTVLLSSSPVSIVINNPKEVNTNQSVDFTIEVTSNSPTVLKNLLLTTDYPFGFNFVKSEPNFYSKNNVWLIGDLEPGAKRTIRIFGALSGQEGEERGFNFSVGTQSKTNTTIIDAPFSSAFSAITIRRPFVSADIFFNGEDVDEYVATAGEKIEVIIRWRNNLSYQVSNASILLKIDGNAIDKSSVRADSGFYRSSDNTIIFDKTTNSVFKNLGPGASGESKFEFKSFSPSSITGSGLSNPTVVLTILVKGEKTDYGANPENVLFTEERKIKLTSAAQLFAKALYYIGPFKNTGPIPPKAETESTYTIIWTVTNPLNNLSAVRASAVLPQYVRWLDKVSPSQEKVSYNEDTREVSWSLGNVLAGAGRISPAREVSFQISFFPSVSQIGAVPNLIGESTLTGRDPFTNKTFTSILSTLNTRLNSDPYFKVGLEEVTQ